MGIYSTVESGTSAYRSRFHKSISYSKNYDCNFGQAIPILEKFVLPGDIWRIGGNALIRFLPMTSPSMTPNKFKVRYFFIPLRLLNKDAEFIITGSQDGHFNPNLTVPEFKNFVGYADKTVDANAFKVAKHSFYDYLGIPVGDYEPIKDNACLPADYWKKGYLRLNWDYFSDENFGGHGGYPDFDSYYEVEKKRGADCSVFSVRLPKDYFQSALPWQLKGNVPMINISGSANIIPNFGDTVTPESGNVYNNIMSVSASSVSTDIEQGFYVQGGTVHPTYLNTHLTESGQTQDTKTAMLESVKTGVTKFLENSKIEGNLGFSADELRTMMAQTRIFERLARTGSRYTEYLRANFGTAPEDGTLQRAQYLGGWSMPIVTTEVLQTAEDGTNPVGTMRGHGISNGGNRITTFYAKEFGIILGIAYVLPKVQYTQGIPRELTYKRRFDFFNPSFQHLSEQEVRNGELYIDFSDGLNDDTFGFQAYANELRSSVDKVVADMRDGLKYWNQAIHFSSRPNLNNAFSTATNYSNNFNQSFVQVTGNPCNIIVDFYNDLDVYRPMVRYATPGLVDHL